MADSYSAWLDSENVMSSMKQQLRQMSESEREDAFYQNLEFGTGGMRGIIGPGTNRMNLLTVRRAAHGIAVCIRNQGQSAMDRGFVIAFDNRRMSKEFSKEVAAILASYGIRVYLYSEPRTTPQLSFSIRELQTSMGMMITASHNPPEYNGLKVYGQDGAQLNLEDAEQVISTIDKVAGPEELAEIDFNQFNKSGLIHYLGEELDREYQNNVKEIVFTNARLSSTDLKVIFTPLHGASGSTIRTLVDELAIPHFSYVEAQMQPDSEFPTLTSANPEDEEAFGMAINQGMSEKADLLIAVDPDGDRVGLAAWDGRKYHLLNGNETGALALHFVLSQMKSQGTLPEDGRVFKTIVTSEMGRAIAKSFGVETEDVLTGFKFIGEKIRENEKDNTFTYLFGYEESYGYLVKPFARDKDAIQMVILLTEMAAFYHQQGKTLLDGLNELYQLVGVYKESLVAITVPGATGAIKIQQALQSVRSNPPEMIAYCPVIRFEDYLSQVRMDQGTTHQLTLPKANVLKFVLEDGTWVCLRPSGTEPKIKYYIGVQSETIELANSKLQSVIEWVKRWMELKLNV